MTLEATRSAVQFLSGLSSLQPGREAQAEELARQFPLSIPHWPFISSSDHWHRHASVPEQLAVSIPKRPFFTSTTPATASPETSAHRSFNSSLAFQPSDTKRTPLQYILISILFRYLSGLSSPQLSAWSLTGQVKVEVEFQFLIGLSILRCSPTSGRRTQAGRFNSLLAFHYFNSLTRETGNRSSGCFNSLMAF
jgi:hypothetical protein